MATPSLVDIVHDPNTRLGRAVLLFEEHGEDIEPIGGGIYMVPDAQGARGPARGGGLPCARRRLEEVPRGSIRGAAGALRPRSKPLYGGRGPPGVPGAVRG